MAFRTRNCFYLRISEKTVVPLYLYLDERHLEWMSDIVLQHVLSDLRPRILPKLQAESGLAGSSSAKKTPTSTVDTHRGDTYQFCYFIRSVEPHSVIVKTRKFVAAPPRHGFLHPAPKPAPSKSRGAKRKAPTVSKLAAPAPRKKRWRKKQASESRMEDEDSSDGEDIYVSDTDEDVGMEDEIEIDTEGENGRDPLGLELEEEEEKPKPLLQLNYQGFGIHGKSICVVVEPWPALPKASKTGTIESLGGLRPPGRSRPSAPPRSSELRGETPLFLPDDSDQVEFESANLYTMDDDGREEDEDTLSNMMMFSQALRNAGDNRPSAAADDDDMDAAVLFGDADETREL